MITGDDYWRSGLNSVPCRSASSHCNEASVNIDSTIWWFSRAVRLAFTWWKSQTTLQVCKSHTFCSLLSLSLFSFPICNWVRSFCELRSKDEVLEVAAVHDFCVAGDGLGMLQLTTALQIVVPLTQVRSISLLVCRGVKESSLLVCEEVYQPLLFYRYLLGWLLTRRSWFSRHWKLWAALLSCVVMVPMTLEPLNRWDFRSHNSLCSENPDGTMSLPSNLTCSGNTNLYNKTRLYILDFEFTLSLAEIIWSLIIKRVDWMLEVNLKCPCELDFVGTCWRCASERYSSCERRYWISNNVFSSLI